MNQINLYLFYLLSVYPLFAFLFRQGIDTRPNYFIIILYLILVARILLFKQNIRLPKYLLFYLLFVIYVSVGDLINGKLSDPQFITGMFGLPAFLEYLIKNSLVSTFLVFFIVENTYFPEKFINNITKILSVLVITAVIVIVIQVFIPKFFLCSREYDLAIFRSDVRRFSIFSWINTGESGYSFPAIISIIVSINFLRNKSRNIYFLFFFWFRLLFFD